MIILVTGGCGFIGSNFINYYFEKYLDCIIVCLDAMYYCASLDNININIRESSRFIFVKGNLNEYNLIYDILYRYKITHIVHYAAQSHVDNSFNNSLQYTEDNVKGTHTLLEAIRNVNKTLNKSIKLIHFSTDEVYGESLLDSDMKKTESSILCPTNPYAASKAAAEMYVLSYIHSFKLDAIITRGNNVYGLHQYPEKLIPKFIEQLKNNIKCTIHGKGKTVRNFIHAYDVSTAVDIILQNGIVGEVYNIGSNSTNEMSVMDVTKILINRIHKTDNIDNYIDYVEDRPFNDKRYFISNEKLSNLGWVQTISFDEGISELLKYYEL